MHSILTKYYEAAEQRLDAQAIALRELMDRPLNTLRIVISDEREDLDCQALHIGRQLQQHWGQR